MLLLQPMRRIATFLLSLLFATALFAQQGANRGSQQGGKSGKDEPEKAIILPDVRTWKMQEDYTFADTLPNDTALLNHQIPHQLWRNNFANLTLGNNGSPAQSLFFPTIKRVEGFTFLNTIAPYLEADEDMLYYNTRTPYCNLAYQMSYPKRRSDEYVHVIFTQNVNRRFNVGFKFQLSSSIGRYESQRTDHVNFRFFGSHDGDYYRNNFLLVYHKAQIDENGGITNDEDILDPSDEGSDKPEDVQVNLMYGTNYFGRYQMLYNHSYDIAHVTRIDEDSIETEVPVASLHHKLTLETTHHEFILDDISSYSDDVLINTFGTTSTILHNDTTYDQVKYTDIGNLFQIKMSEEFNTLLRFGLRLYLGNNIRTYHWDAPSDIVYDEDEEEYIYNRQRQGESRVTTYVGGQIFKNTGDAFLWNAGAKLYIQGYNAGDFKIDGLIQTSFPVFNRKTTLYAKGYIDMRSPEIFEEEYVGNHFQWDKSLDREKTVYLEAGLRWGETTHLMGYMATLTDRVYYGEDCLPTQKSDATEVLGAYLKQHFRGAGFNSLSRMAVQYSSDDDVLALPTFAIYSSNFFEHLFFGVLTFQIGFDFRYNSKYYAPAYQPAIMQFYVQHERKVGGHYYLDPFINFHIKRVRVYLRYDHVNKSWGSQDYFHTIHYPANPGTMRWGISWNFYD